MIKIPENLVGAEFTYIDKIHCGEDHDVEVTRSIIGKIHERDPVTGVLTVRFSSEFLGDFIEILERHGVKVNLLVE